MIRFGSAAASTVRRPRHRAWAASLAAAGALAAGLQASPASAATKVDGTWTVSSGGTGQIVFNGDFTYTSTCQVLTSFPQAACPSASGTFAFNGAYLTFTGADNSSLSLRMSGPITAPTGLSHIVPNYGGLIVDRGASFTCSTFFDSTYAFTRGPLAYISGSTAYALGSNQNLGAVNAGNYVYLAETKPGYLVEGQCP